MTNAAGNTGVDSRAIVEYGTFAVVAWIVLVLICLYVIAYVHRDMYSVIVHDGKASPLYRDATLSSVLVSNPLRVVGGVLLGLAVVVLGVLEYFRDTKWFGWRVAVVCALLASWICVIIFPENVVRNQCPVDGSAAQEALIEQQRRAQMKKHYASAGSFILMMAAWVWLQASATQHHDVWIIGIFMLTTLAGFLTCFIYSRLYPGMSKLTIKRVFTTLEAVHLLLLLLAMVFLTTAPTPL